MTMACSICSSREVASSSRAPGLNLGLHFDRDCSTDLKLTDYGYRECYSFKQGQIEWLVVYSRDLGSHCRLFDRTLRARN